MDYRTINIRSTTIC